ncbi:MAG: CoA pyrophosphatase [Proteobacteria bacterium]|nr:CoA pyrophosphatase [Pseudomonadota bacterium]
MLQLETIRDALGAHRATSSEASQRAAVAVVLRPVPGQASPEVLFIERARFEGDPWSGHMAFPGGRVDPGDPSPRAAAERETWEEVGLSLAEAEHLGRLDDLQGRQAGRPSGLVISAHVYRWEGRAPLQPNHEVEQAFWFPLASLLDSSRHVTHRSSGLTIDLPGILVGEPGRHVVWGLTYRFVEMFFQIVGQPLPARWPDGHWAEGREPESGSGSGS